MFWQFDYGARHNKLKHILQHSVYFENYASNGYRQFKSIVFFPYYSLNKETSGLTSAHFFGSTRRPIRPASLALNVFWNSGVITELEL